MVFRADKRGAGRGRGGSPSASTASLNGGAWMSSGGVGDGSSLSAGASGPIPEVGAGSGARGSPSNQNDLPLPATCSAVTAYSEVKAFLDQRFHQFTAPDDPSKRPEVYKSSETAWTTRTPSRSIFSNKPGGVGITGSGVSFLQELAKHRPRGRDPHQGHQGQGSNQALVHSSHRSAGNTARPSPRPAFSHSSNSSIGYQSGESSGKTTPVAGTPPVSTPRSSPEK